MEFLQKVKEKIQTILVITLLTGAVVFSVSAFLPPQYGSEISILVIQKQPSDKVDAFSAAKSAEYLGDILAKVAYSDAFIENVLASPYKPQIDFPQRGDKRKEYWSKMIDVDRVNNTGIVNVIVYDKSPASAENIAEAISWAYIVRGHQFHGGGDRVKIEKIDGPITPTNPVKPNLLLNTLLGIVFGIIGSIALVYFFEDFELKVFRKKSKNIIDKDFSSQKEIPTNGIEKFRQKIGDYASFDEYVFDAKKDSDKTSNIEESPVVEKTEERKREVVEIKEPNSFEGEFSFESALVDEKKKEKSEIPVFQSDKTPGNLPTFEGDMDFLVKNGAVKSGSDKEESLDKVDENLDNRESTEEEVREKLNKLLRGEM